MFTHPFSALRPRDPRITNVGLIKSIFKGSKRGEKRRPWLDKSCKQKLQAVKPQCFL